jgi:glucosamine--fructose-6-phosphate aminotransferase (isomerizing)
MTRGAHTWQEILSQPQTWRATLEAFAGSRAALESFLARATFDQIITVGCGSTHYLAQTAAAALTHRTGLPAWPRAASELWLFPGTVPSGRTLLLPISRSGTTTETLRALERFRGGMGGPALAVSCYPSSPLVQAADFALVSPAAQEESVAQTRSFTSMLLLTQALTAVLAQDQIALERLHRLPQALEDLLGRAGDRPREVGRDLDLQRIFFLGGGPFYGLANEAMLKTKEMSLSHAEAYHPLEFRHGPMSMVDEHALVVGLLSDTALEEELRVLRDMEALGARILALIEDGSALADWRADQVVELRSGLGEWERGPLCLVVLQLLAYHRAIAKGLDPDRPRNLTAVVEL